MIDIETKPSLAHIWSLWDQHVGLSQVQDFGEMICFAAGWEHDRKVKFYSVYHDSQEEMLASAHDLLDEADVVTGWNSKSFDVKHIQRELMLAGHKPPSPFKQLDLMHETKKKFRFVSNKLEHVAK